jgi:hypothetical protein
MGYAMKQPRQAALAVRSTSVLSPTAAAALGTARRLASKTMHAARGRASSATTDSRTALSATAPSASMVAFMASMMSITFLDAAVENCTGSILAGMLTISL